MAVVCSLLISVTSIAEARRPDGRRLLQAEHSHDQVSPALEARMQQGAEHNIAMLQARNELLPLQSGTKQLNGLVWPLGPVPGAGVDWHAISGFVDLDPAFPNQVRDYTCSNRSYDTAAGYNHRGVDIIPWPFAWDLMDASAVDVLAAAPGQLIEKVDGAPDRSCSWDGPDIMNYVIVLHADGTIARYLHMKAGTVTTRPIGAPIAAGEYLGKVGSSGISKLPHLHFELRRSNAVNAGTIEAFSGACNTAPPANWASQRPYRDSALNRLSTHSAEPEFPTCPDTIDRPHFKNRFVAGDPITFGAAYRDQGRGQLTTFRVLRPDASVFSSWTFDVAEEPGTAEYYSGTFWNWNQTLPPDAPVGTWTFEATYLGTVSRHSFTVSAAANTVIADPRGLIGAWFEPATSGQGFDLHWLDGDVLLVFFYGHHDDGSNLFLIGTHNGAPRYGVAIDMAMTETRGGRFNALDPAAIRRQPWGTLRLTVNNCASARAELTGADGNSVLSLQRLGRTPGLDCD
ncbi:MAG: peptidoglycan DD-metalloendopeptidase family protein [Rhodanobacteraceae bacterium]|nr:peptidoglycan DD-metalloendopeptidase family protein [Rhodanobacteraceae bacterium]